MELLHNQFFHFNRVETFMSKYFVFAYFFNKIIIYFNRYSLIFMFFELIITYNAGIMCNNAELKDKEELRFFINYMFLIGGFVFINEYAI